MRCMSCSVEVGMADAKIFHKLFLCKSCYALAEKSEREIEREIERAKGQSLNWLTEHILRGGLLAGGTGIKPK